DVLARDRAAEQEERRERGPCPHDRVGVGVGEQPRDREARGHRLLAAERVERDLPEDLADARDGEARREEVGAQRGDEVRKETWWVAHRPIIPRRPPNGSERPRTPPRVRGRSGRGGRASDEPDLLLELLGL